MNITDTLKEYFVSIGFKIDDFSLDHTQKVMDSVEGLIKDFAGSSTLNFAKAAAGIITFLVDINIGLAKFMAGLGQADLQTQIFAQKTGLSVDKARAYQSSLSALGASQEDLNSSPELRQRFFALQQQALQMQIPAQEYEPAMKSIRDMAFEFQRLKLEGMDALQWIGYYLLKDVEPVLEQSGISLKDINDNIQKNMPQWAEKIAQIASWFVRLGAAAWDARGALAVISTALMAPKLFSLATNPIFLMIAGLTTLLLLIDDYKTWERGGKSALDWTWTKSVKNWIEDLKKSMEDKGIISNFKKDIQGLTTDFSELGTNIDNLIKKLTGGKGLGEVLKTGILNTFEKVDALLQSISGSLEIINGILSGNMNQVNKGSDKLLPALNTILMGTPESGKKLTENEDKIWAFIKNPGSFFKFELPKVEPKNSPKSWDFFSKYEPNLSSNKEDIGKTAFRGPDETISAGTGANVPWSNRIYNTLSVYRSKIASALGIEINGINGNSPQSFAHTAFAQKMNDFLSNYQSGVSLVNYSPWPVLSGNTNNNHNTQLSLQSNFNIYGASDPQTTARVVELNQNQLLTRYVKGVQL